MSRHKELLEELEGYARSAADPAELMQDLAALLHERLARYNWVGFYLADPSVPRTLVLGPYVGSFTPLPKISFGAGLCGTAAATGKTVVVNNVAADMRYVARAELVKSEIVVPVLSQNQVVAIIDVESYFADTFGAEDQEFLEACAALAGRFIAAKVGAAQR